MNLRPSEVYELTKLEASQGILPMMQGLYARKNDTGENPEYGTDYTTEYNSVSTVKHMFVPTRISAFLWFAATYEAGGSPGVLWNDYTVDGAQYHTQKREMMFFNKKLQETLGTPEGIAWVNAGGGSYNPDAIPGKWSYEPSYVQDVLDKAMREHVPGQTITG